MGLTLRRRKGESLIIFAGGKQITVEVVGGRGGLLSIDAPDDVVIHRRELYDDLQRNRADAKTLGKAGRVSTAKS